MQVTITTCHNSVLITARQRCCGKLMFIIYDALNLTVYMTRDPQLLTSGGQHWRPVQTCSLAPPPPGATSGGQSPKHIWFASGRYASYWNAFLLKSCLCPPL